MVQWLNVFQQVQLTLRHGCWPRLLCEHLSVCVFGGVHSGVVLFFNRHICLSQCAFICGGVGWFCNDILRFSFLHRIGRARMSIVMTTALFIASNNWLKINVTRKWSTSTEVSMMSTTQIPEKILGRLFFSSLLILRVSIMTVRWLRCEKRIREEATSCLHNWKKLLPARTSSVLCSFFTAASRFSPSSGFSHDAPGFG